MMEEPSSRASRVAVVGASGFLGSALVTVLQSGHAQAMPVQAPRISTDLRPQEHADIVDRLVSVLTGIDCCVNAAGAVHSAMTRQQLTGANTVLPGLLAEATARLGVRYIHISSGAVQGRRATLDSCPVGDEGVQHLYSDYAISKAQGERVVNAANPDACIYRPPGIHGLGRSTTRKITKVARSPFAVVARPGAANSPHAHVLNVADALRFLATTPAQLPKIVHHPSESLTTSDFFLLLGGRPPRMVPRAAADGLISVAYRTAQVRPALAAHARQIEVLLVGQQQAPSWLSDAGWTPPYGRQAWGSLGERDPAS